MFTFDTYWGGAGGVEEGGGELKAVPALDQGGGQAWTRLLPGAHLYSAGLCQPLGFPELTDCHNIPVE